MFELKNITITDIPKDLQATNATLVNSFSGSPTISINPTYVGFSGSLRYTTPDGSTNLASTSFVPDIKKISKDGTEYTLKSAFSGPDGKLTLNGPAKSAQYNQIAIQAFSYLDRVLLE